MNSKEQKKRTEAITLIAQEQSIGIGHGMMSLKKGAKPYKTLDNIPIFHSSTNTLEFEQPKFQASKTHQWGQYYHPDMVVGMPPFGGKNKVYIDTRIAGWYLLWISTKLDEWAVGQNSWEASLIAWTPKVKKDTIDKAGYRMFWASSLAMDDNYCFDSEDVEWLDNWGCSIKTAQIFASIRKTKYKDERHYSNTIKTAPLVFRDSIEANKIV